MMEPLQRALDSVADAAPLDWAALESESADDETLSTLQALRDIAAIARFHDVRPRIGARTLPFYWGPLEIREFLARGAHGDVYRAWDPRLERDVALKLLRGEAFDSHYAPVAITEGRLLARVQHPNVVAVYGADRIDGEAGLWMEFVQGPTLRDLVLERGPLPVEEAIAIGIAVCNGLAAIHAAGLVHRDIKAQNVVRASDGRTILMDLSAGRDLTANEDRLEGTPLYIAPELFEGGRASTASDIYAVGVLMFFLVTARYPLSGASLTDLRDRHRAGDGDRLAASQLPPPFAAVVDRALAREPHNRFESADAMSAALRAAVEKRRPLFAAAVMALTVIMTAAAVGGLVVGRPGDDDPRPRMLGGAVIEEQDEPQKIRLPYWAMGAPSGDGTVFPYVDEDGHVSVWEVRTGESRRIVAATPEDGRSNAAAMSADGRNVAYGWRRADGAHELRTVRGDGTVPRTVISRSSAFEPVPVEWSEDGHWILCWLRQRNGAADLALVPRDGGAPRLLHTTDGAGPVDARLSPDDRYVLLSNSFEREQLRGVHLVDIAQRQVQVLLPNSANERMARWMPDGSGVLFLRDSTAAAAAHDVWLAPVSNGELQGEPTLAVSNIGAVLDVGLTNDGAFYRTISLSQAEVYIASIDLSGATPPGAPTRISPTEMGNHVGASWSPDGSRLAYFTTRRGAPGTTGARILTIQDVGSGETIQVDVPLLFVGGYSPRWSPDGREVLIWGRNEERVEDFGYFRVDLQSGAVTRVLTLGMNAPALSQYAADGQRIYYVDPKRGIVSRALASGEESIVVPRGKREAIGNFALAPALDSIAFIGHYPNGVTCLEMLSSDGRQRELTRAVQPSWVALHAVTPDTTGFVFARGTGAKPYSLWLMPSAGGEPVDMQLSLVPTANPISLSPDGRRIAYTERVMRQELWSTPAPSTPWRE
jgi:serine/threonine-protein kinase